MVSWVLNGGLLKYIRKEIMANWCADNLKNGGYSSDTSAPYKYRVLPIQIPTRAFCWFKSRLKVCALYNYCPCVSVTWRFVHHRQVILLCDDNMTICSPEAGNIAILPVEGEQIMLPLHKANHCFIIPKKMFTQSAEQLNTDQHCVFVSFAVKLYSAGSQKMYTITV